jgi:hypothetical protein
MKRLFADLARRFTGGDDALAARPILAGYRREMAPGWRISILAALALIALIYGLAFGYMAPARMMPLIAPIALLCGLVIWALPDGDYAPVRVIEPLFIAFFAALIIWPNYLAVALPSLPWLTLLRIIGVPLIAVVLVCVSVSSSFRTKLLAVIRTDPAILWLLLVLVATQTVTLGLSRDPGFSLNRWIIAQVNGTAIFVAAAICFIRPGFAEYWVRLLLVMLLMLCAFGIWEARIGHVPWASHIPGFIKIDDENVLKILAGASRAATGIYRVQGTATTSLGFAEILGLAVPFAMHLAIDRYPIVIRMLGATFIPIAVYVILLTDSRLGMVATLASMIFYLLFWAIFQWKRNRFSLLGPAIVISYPAIFCAFVASTFLIGRLRAQVWGDGSQQASTDSRIDQWIMAFPKVIRNPIGHGVGQGADTLGFANQAGVITIDSYYLSLLLEIGVIGFIAYFAMFIRGIFLSTSILVNSKEHEIRLLMPISVSLINFIIVKSVLSQDANHPLAFMMIGAIVGLAYRARNHSVGDAQPAIRGS